MLTMSLILNDDQMHSWGWRLPFLVAAPLGLIGVYLRSRLDETPVFQELEDQGREQKGYTAEFKDLMVQYWRPILRLGGLVVALNVVNYTLLTYMPTYLGVTIGLSDTMSLLVPIIGMLSMMVFLPFAGHLSDRVGRKPMWWFSLIGLFIAGVPMFLLMSTGPMGAVLGFAVLGLLYVPQLATISATFPAMFPTQVRYAGFAIAYNVSTSLFGGTAPAVNDWMINATGDNLRRVLHDGRLRDRRDRVVRSARDRPLSHRRYRDTGHRGRSRSAGVRGRRRPVSLTASGQSGADIHDLAEWVDRVDRGRRRYLANRSSRGTPSTRQPRPPGSP